MEQIRQVLEQCLEAAARVHRSYYAKLTSAQTVAKSTDFDLLTVADTESEQAVIELITRHFPEHGILTEESGEHDRPGASIRWVIDPLDGTTNYSHGFPQFCSSIAVEFDGQTRLAAVYNPLREDLFKAELGSGATHNGQPIRVSATPQLEQSLLVTGFPYDRRTRIDHYLRLYKAFTMKCHGVLRLGSAALDLCHIAAGWLDGYYEESLNEWDWAAGNLIVSEAGGRVTDFIGGDQVLERSELCVSNGLIHDQMLALLKPTD